MSRRIADLLIKIGADSYEFQQKVSQVERGLDGLSKKLTSVGKEMSLKLTAPLAAIGVIAVQAQDAVEKAAAKVQQGIIATGGAAKLTLSELQSQASQLQNITVFDDDEILNEVTSRLLTFTNIAGNTFKRTQAAALDLATVLDKDLGSVAMQLGKALNDPVTKLNSLSKIGVTFSKEQQETIKALAETNRLAEAQGLILDELARKYGGQAEAAAKVGLGPLQQLKNSWGDFLESIGAVIMPMLTRLAASLKNVVDWLQNLSPATKKTIVVIAGIAAAVGPLALGLGSLLKFLPLLKAGFMLLLAPIGAVRGAVIALSTAIAANPIGLLLTALSVGIGLFIAFRKSTDDAAQANGELTNKVIDESKQVNLLIAKLSSANTSEDERRKALEELKKIQPAIVEGLSAEKLELETLTKRASEYNQQLVLRIALARKQDQVTAAIERQTEAGVKQAEKEAELYKKLTDIGANIASGNFEFGRHNQNKGFFEWNAPTKNQQKYILDQFNAIMASGDQLDEKARKVWLLFKPSTNYSDKIRMDVNPRGLQTLRGELSKLGKEINEAGDAVGKAEDDVRNFAEAFSLSLNTAVEQTVTTTDELTDSLGGTGTAVEAVKGRIALLNDQISKLEKQKQSAFDIEEIARCNTEIEKLKKEVGELNSITLEQLNRKPLTPILTGDLANIKPIVPKFEIKLDGLIPMVNKAAEQMKQVRESVREGIFGWAAEISSELQESIMETEQVVSTYTEALVAKGWKFSEALDFVSQKVGEVMRGFDESLNRFLAGSVEAAAEAIGQMLAGDLGFDGLMKAILLQLAGFLKSIGSQLIQFGVMIIAFKTALKSVLANPWAAIAVGAAMVAAAAIMTALINKNAQKNAPKLAKGGLAYGPTYAMVGDNPNARVDPEVIAPLSKLKSMMTGGGSQNIQIALSGQLTAKGRDLVYVLGKENFKIDVLGG